MADENKDIYGGIFNFDSIMKDFYSDQGKSDEQKIMKSAFQGNYIQSGINAQLSNQLAQTQSAISKDQMKFAADLEQRNTASNYEQEFEYGSKSMSQQYDLQNRFADNQHQRDLGMVTAKGDDTRKTVAAVGVQDRLSRITQGEQDRLGMVTTGEQNRLTDTNKITTTGTETRMTDTNRIRTTGDETRDTDTNRITTTGDEQRDTDTNRIETTGKEQRLTDTNKIRTTGDETRKTDTNRLTTEGDETRKSDTNRIRTTGDETRTTMEKEDQLLGKKNDRQNARARATARAF